MAKSQFSISISAADRRELKSRAAAEGRSMSGYVAQLIRADLATPQTGGTLMLNGRRRRGGTAKHKREPVAA